MAEKEKAPFNLADFEQIEPGKWKHKESGATYSVPMGVTVEQWVTEQEPDKAPVEEKAAPSREPERDAQATRRPR